MNARLFHTIQDGLSARYSVFAELACGGMAMVYLGQLEAQHGFKRSVAIKKMHPQYARDPEFRYMFMDEARLVAQIRHPNVVPTLDVVTRDDSLLIVMEFVEGEAVSQLLGTARGGVPPRIAAAIVHDALCGLHAAHELAGDDGQALGVIHRDVSPANILVGRDGLARILDFGVAKAAGRSAPTRDGTIKGKVPYMPPEQLWGSELDRTVDIYAASVVLWEMLTGRRLFTGDSEAEVMSKVVDLTISPPSAHVTAAAPLDAVVMRGLSRDPSKRFQTALEMAKAIEAALAPAPRLEVGDWVSEVAHTSLARRSELLRSMKRGEPAPAPTELASIVSVLTASSPRTAIGQALSQPPMAVQRPPQPLGVAAGAIAVLATLATVLAMRAFTPTPALAAAQPAGAVDPPHAQALGVSPAPMAATPEADPSTPPANGSKPVVERRDEGARRDPGEPTPRPVASPPPVAPARASATPSRPSCHLPYTIDTQGIRHFKLECL